VRVIQHEHRWKAAAWKGSKCGKDLCADIDRFIWRLWRVLAGMMPGSANGRTASMRSQMRLTTSPALNLPMAAAAGDLEGAAGVVDRVSDLDALS
jgi:hypothetical protein